MTVIEKIVEEISFNCDKQLPQVIIDTDYVQNQTKDIQQSVDLSRFIL
jgi:ATP-dependent protease HslVU (ClpYQ) ATPase subunit